MVKMLKEIGNDKFTFKKGSVYKFLDGDEMDIKELRGKILIRQPNSPNKKDWWCTFDKSEIGRSIEIVE